LRAVKLFEIAWRPEFVKGLKLLMVRFLKGLKERKEESRILNIMHGEKIILWVSFLLAV